MDHAKRLWDLSNEYALDAGNYLGVKFPNYAEQEMEFERELLKWRIGFLFPNLNKQDQVTLTASAVFTKACRFGFNASREGMSDDGRSGIDKATDAAEQGLMKAKGEVEKFRPSLTETQQKIIDRYLWKINFRES